MRRRKELHDGDTRNSQTTEMTHSSDTPTLVRTRKLPSVVPSNAVGGRWAVGSIGGKNQAMSTTSS